MALNHYTQITEFIRSLASSDPLVNKVTQGFAEKIAFDKMTVFPLVHINVTDFTISDNAQVVIWDLQIGAMKKRDINKEINTDSFYENDNEVDNFNETSAIIIRLVTRIISEFESRKITLSNISTAQKQSVEYGKDLDGYIIALSLELPNNEISLCQYPIP